MQAGGVGFYPTSGSPFVHLDTGSVRHWPLMTRAAAARRLPRRQDAGHPQGWQTPARLPVGAGGLPGASGELDPVTKVASFTGDGQPRQGLLTRFIQTLTGSGATTAPRLPRRRPRAGARQAAGRGRILDLREPGHRRRRRPRSRQRPQRPRPRRWRAPAAEPCAAHSAAAVLQPLPSRSRRPLLRRAGHRRAPPISRRRTSGARPPSRWRSPSR